MRIFLFDYFSFSSHHAGTYFFWDWFPSVQFSIYLHYSISFNHHRDHHTIIAHHNFPFIAAREKTAREVPTKGKEEIQSAKSNRNKISSSFGRTNDVALWDESKVLPHPPSSEPAHCLPLTYLCSFFKQTFLSFYSLPLCVSILSFFISIVVVSLCVCTVISYLLVRVWLLLHNIYYYVLFHFVRVYGKRWYTQVLLLTFSHRHMHMYAALCRRYWR